MVRRPPTATRTDTLFPYTTLFRSARLCRAPRDAGQQSDAAVPQALTVRADRVDRSSLYLALAGFTFRSIAKRNAIRESDAMAGDVSALFTFDEFLTHWAEDRPDRVAMREEGRVFTYGEIEDRTARVASALLAAGLMMGDRIAWIGQYRDRKTEEWG